MINEGDLIPYSTTPLPVADGPWLVLAPHADDESFGMGATLLKARAADIAVHLVVMTDGALGGQQFDLVSVRRQEARNAARVLGIGEITFLEQPDRGLQVSDALVQTLANLISTIKPAAVFFPGVMELHPDHRACALLAWQALSAAGHDGIVAVSYEIAVQSPVNCLVDITGEMAGKQQAMAVYMSQLGQNNYVEIVKAQNRLRTLTLEAEVLWAEGFYVYSAQERNGSLSNWIVDKAKLLLMP